MTEVSILIFKKGFKDYQIPLPTRFDHCEIFVEYDDESHSQYLYHADKESLNKLNTRYEAKSIGWIQEGVKKKLTSNTCRFFK
jgi:hypothetical protein